MAGSGGTGPGSGAITDPGRGLGGTRRQRRRNRRKATFGRKAMPEHRLGDKTEKGGDNSFTQTGKRNGVRIFSRKNSPYRWARDKDGNFRPIEGSAKKAGTGSGGQRNRPPRDPYASQVNAAAELQYGPQEREIAYQRVVEAQRGTNQNAWYDQHYQRALQQAQATQAGYANAQQQAYQQGNQAMAGDQQANAALFAQQNADAAQRGTQVDPALQAQAQQGAAQRQQQQTQFGNLTGNLGANESAYGQARAGQASEQGIQAQSDTQARQRKVESLHRELLADKQAFKSSKRLDLADAEWKRKLEAQAFGLDLEQEENDQENEGRDDRRDARQDAATRRNNRRTRRETERHNRETEAKARETEARIRRQDLADDGKLNNSAGKDGDGDGDGPTPTATRGNKSDYETLRAIGRRNPNKGYSWHYDNMIDAGYDALMASVAARRAAGQSISRGLARKFKRRYGFLPKGVVAPRSPSLTPRNPDGTPG